MQRQLHDFEYNLYHSVKRIVLINDSLHSYKIIIILKHVMEIKFLNILYVLTEVGIVNVTNDWRV